MLESYVKKILGSKVYDLAVESPLSDAPLLSRRLGLKVSLKREDKQSVYSFKLRGAYNKMAQLSDDQKAVGVITASAGNHAQGVAISAQKLGIRATIVMGQNTPSIKVNAVRDRGAKVELHGENYEEASQHAETLCEAQGRVYIPPYDDVDVIAGQGTIGMEIVNQHREPLDAIFVPVGGGGLVAGVAAYVKYLHPQIKIIGVEAQGSNCLDAAIRAGRRVRLPIDQLDLFADGVSVTQIGKETFKVAKKYVDDVVVVNVDEICAAIKDVFEDTRCVAEPAGALAIAGMKRYVDAHPGMSHVVSIVSGANVNFDRLRHISERAEVGEAREAVLAVTIDEAKGSFLKFCRALGKRAITEFNYRCADSEQAHIYVGIGVKSKEDRMALVAQLESKGYRVFDMTENEAAKVHVRHMVGGHRGSPGSEMLFRFEFPERPGALLQFLSGLGVDWNISLFHYRNHGSAWGRVLVGFDAGAAELKQLQAYLQRIGYRFWSEHDNPAYDLFLR
ncbi:MAG: threonine ammonia-lyase, biosynthetic [Pseudomonadota bacterium]|nr:threonine ammonia-lyase, biosynthetic [Pseudomonadota bacterium]